MNNEMILRTLPKENIKKELTEDSVVQKIRTTADYRQSKKSHYLWDKPKKPKKANKLLTKQDNGQLPTSPGSILEHTAYDGQSYLQNANYISDFARKSKELRAENEPSSL